jgi:hypothetical protein
MWEPLALGLPFFFGSDYDKFVALLASCTHGGILIAWKSSVLHVSSMAAMGLHT